MTNLISLNWFDESLDHPPPTPPTPLHSAISVSNINHKNTRLGSLVSYFYFLIFFFEGFFFLRTSIGMVCCTGATSHKKLSPPNSSSQSRMQVQRAKKCKLWSEGGQNQADQQQQQQQQQQQSSTDPCPLLQPFCHQVISSIQTAIHYWFQLIWMKRSVATLNSCNWISRQFVSL